MFKLFHVFENFTSYLYVVNFVSRRDLAKAHSVAYIITVNDKYFGTRRYSMSVKNAGWIISIWNCGVGLVVQTERIDN
jgi:hypothetical protein